MWLVFTFSFYFLPLCFCSVSTPNQGCQANQEAVGIKSKTVFSNTQSLDINPGSTLPLCVTLRKHFSLSLSFFIYKRGTVDENLGYTCFLYAHKGLVVSNSHYVYLCSLQAAVNSGALILIL